MLTIFGRFCFPVSGWFEKLCNYVQFFYYLLNNEACDLCRH